MIELKNISKVFNVRGEDITAVRDVNLTIREGSIFGVIGFSGAGKSTLIRMFNQLESPSSGEVVIGDDSMSNLSPKALRKKREKVSMVFQHFNLLWSRTVLQNIMYPLEIAGVNKKEARVRAFELVERVGLSGRESYYPSQLSGGQKQRVGIARALANGPSVLLCDEATSALDPRTTDEILDLLVRLKEEEQLTIVLITHEMHVIRKICDEVAVMEHGEIIEVGPVRDVFESPKHAVTKEFIKEDIDDDGGVIEQLIDEQMYHIYRLKFIGESTTEPIVSYLTKAYDIEVNILQANMKYGRDGAYGSLLVQFLPPGGFDFEVIQRDLKSRHVEIEVVIDE
ncbi:methionine ABC transporter ATP-binding protein [Abyssicoccus albus]|uniref:methionine ABC transporter ATP-binding protein n=1 Tax=Abyssicoccus albus TaxID=1817405 RepID=UPI00097E3848|nr:methionine ABC transporter ATP-binding protein [Abyssicoccus albus]AQL56662.1 methionine ABC transporter ATP-binding protein [Abyssicoccus albus]